MTPQSPPLRIGIVDSDSGFVRVLVKRLEALGWDYWVSPGAAPPDELLAKKLNVLVLNLGVLGPTAWEYLEQVCGALPGMGVVVCTSPSTVAQRVRGLRLGADDWVTKPCHPEEVLARIEAITRRRRRSRGGAEAGPVVAGEVEIRADQYQAFVAGRSLELTRREFELLQTLLDASGRVIEREDVYQRVWGYTMARGDRSVDVFVRKLRQKLTSASPQWRYIHTHFGIGYRFEAEPTADAREAEQAPAAPSSEAEAPADLGTEAIET